jgi:hypothetical protein
VQYIFFLGVLVAELLILKSAGKLSGVFLLAGVDDNAGRPANKRRLPSLRTSQNNNTKLAQQVY